MIVITLYQRLHFTSVFFLQRIYISLFLFTSGSSVATIDVITSCMTFNVNSYKHRMLLIQFYVVRDMELVLSFCFLYTALANRSPTIAKLFKAARPRTAWRFSINSTTTALIGTTWHAITRNPGFARITSLF